MKNELGTKKSFYNYAVVVLYITVAIVVTMLLMKSCENSTLKVEKQELIVKISTLQKEISRIKQDNLQTEQKLIAINDSLETLKFQIEQQKEVSISQLLNWQKRLYSANQEIAFIKSGLTDCDNLIFANNALEASLNKRQRDYKIDSIRIAAKIMENLIGSDNEKLSEIKEGYEGIVGELREENKEYEAQLAEYQRFIYMLSKKSKENEQQLAVYEVLLKKNKENEQQLAEYKMYKDSLLKKNKEYEELLQKLKECEILVNSLETKLMKDRID